ncbi:response regulator [Methanoregula formicica]|uniref:histidine kinase n=1 Tax=Methanoregula formicica (strain DSM 22288 / NBRC 105244 / SMSP) TaxID=593750 RepID=L0HH41_METFS|nr:PAS domain S-box protein [Methanoregula formicica]AGB03330.1 PAS domain S-box [Methanoregula formicica SMSP]
MPDRIRALYVDDEPGLLEVARLFIEQSPEFIVETAESAQAALKSPAIASCDAIISDYQMPGMDGIAFLKAVREKYGDIPFILFTGRGREEVVIDAINNGADFYLQKGGDPTAQFAELAHKIRQAVSRKRSQDELKAAYEQITASEEELRGQYEELAAGERRVRESQERYRSVIENSPYGMHFYELDPVRGLVFAGANPAADRILGICHEELVGRTILEAFPGLAGTEIPMRYRGVAESGTPWQTEQVVYEKGVIHGAFAVTVFRPARGSMAAMFLDITGRKKAEMERQESEERLRSFMDSATDSFSIWDARLNLVDMNRVALSYLPPGTRKEDIIGRNLNEFLSGEGEWGSIERYREIMKTGVPLTGTEKMTESATGTRWLSVKCFRVGDGLGIMTTDVTQEKAAEDRLREAYDNLAASEEELRQQFGELVSAQEELRESRQQMTEIADTVPGVIYQSHFRPDEKEKFTFISSRGPEVFGISADPDGFSERFFAQVDKDDQEPLARSISQAVKNELPWEYEGRFTRPSGEKIWFQGMARPVRKPSGLYYTGVLLDITSRKQAEEALRSSEERLRLFIQQAPVAIAMFDNEMRYLAASRRWLADASLSDRDIAGRSHYEIFPNLPDDLKDAYRRALAGEVVSSSEYRFVNESGAVQWFTWEVRPWYNIGDTIGGIILFSEDITKRKEVEERLRESEVKYRSLMDVSPVAVAVHRNGKVVYVNPEAVQLLKSRRAEDLIGKEVLPFIHPDYHEKAREEFRRMADDGEMIPLQEETFLATNGEPFTVEVVAKPIRYEGLPSVFVAFRDITERKKMEAALRESEEKYRNLVENATEAIFIHQDWRMIYANPRMAELLGVPVGNILEHLFLDYVWPADRAFVLDRYTRRMAGEDVPTNYDFRMTAPEGKLLWVHISIANITWQQKPATLNLLTDITERKRAETALQEAWRKLALLNSLTRHDIRNQLITLQGFTQFAKKKEQDPAIAGYLEKIDSCATMIRGQIEFMKTYHELGVNSPSWYLLDTVVSKACIRELPCRNLCSGTGVFADPMLEKVFFNLFDNACRHGEHATEVVVRCERKGDELTIVVEDNGIGIPDNEKEKIFGKGFGKNTGFGLFLVREILSITGITIRETGTPGKGARFEILVPRECWRKNGA